MPRSADMTRWNRAYFSRYNWLGSIVQLLDYCVGVVNGPAHVYAAQTGSRRLLRRLTP